MAQRIDAKRLLLQDLLVGMVDIGEYGRLLISDVSLDSREARAGGLFMAVAGQTSHGMDHLAQAVSQGVVAILAEPAGDWERARLVQAAGRLKVPLFMVSRLREKAGIIAARFFGHPGQALRVIGVTGTNGKTSVSHFLAHCLAHRVASGVLGTLGNGRVDDLRPASHTTPDATAVQAELARQAGMGIKAVAMEVSSHALDQGRVNGLPFHTAVFTNLTHEHLDYHGSMSAYAEAKASLFRRPGLMNAVINSDDAYGQQLIEEVSERVAVVACSLQKGPRSSADRFVHATEVEPGADGLRIKFDSSWGAGEFHARLLGRFNAENLLLTLAVLLSWDMPIGVAVESLQDLRPVPGRMNLMGGRGMPRVVVDYAHTPDALAQVLSSLREHVRGRLVCVFGCGGERDREKRPRMGELAQRLADRVILTDDNPRREDPDAIVAGILAGMTHAEAVVVQRDRARAIAQAIAEAGPDDLVLLAGKGHEAYQLVGDMRLPFSDSDQARRALGERAA